MTVIYWRILDINTGAFASNAALTTVTAIQLGCDMIYAETDY